MMANNSVEVCNNFLKEYGKHNQTHLQLIENLKDLLKKSNNENMRLNARIAHLESELVEERSKNCNKYKPLNENKQSANSTPGRKSSKRRKKFFDDQDDDDFDLSINYDNSFNLNISQEYVKGSDLRSGESMSSLNKSLSLKEEVNNENSGAEIPEELVKELYKTVGLVYSDKNSMNGDCQDYLVSSIPYYRKFTCAEDELFPVDDRSEEADTSEVLVPKTYIRKKPDYVTSTEMTAGDKKSEQNEILRLEKAHLKWENDEKKSKRWDTQRVRQEKYIEKLTNKQKQKGKKALELQSYLPSSSEIEEICLGNYYPLEAFGCILPRFSAKEFDYKKYL